MIVRHLAGAIELCTQCKVYACVLSKIRNSTSSLVLFNLDVCSSVGVRYAEGKAERFVNELQNERNRRSNIHYWILDLGPDVAAFVYDPKLLVSSSSTREKMTILQKRSFLCFRDLHEEISEKKWIISAIVLLDQFVMLTYIHARPVASLNFSRQGSQFNKRWSFHCVVQCEVTFPIDRETNRWIFLIGERQKVLCNHLQTSAASPEERQGRNYTN